MAFPLARLARAALGPLLALAALLTPGLAQAQRVLRDAETEALLRDMMAPIARAGGLPANNVEVVLVEDEEINAFVVQGQRIYIHSGLINAADNANQLQGVLAHELGHITGGHAVRGADGQAKATGIGVLTTIAGIAAALGGAGDAGMGIVLAGQNAAMNNLLAFSRSEESSADQAGATFLSRAGINGEGSLAFFKKLQNLEYRLAIPQTDSFERTHPLSRERIDALEALYRADPAWGRPTEPAIEARFQRVKAKLLGYLEPKRAVTVYPESDQSLPAHYARAYAYHRSAYPQKVKAEVAALVKAAPDDPYFLELQGQTLLEGGDPRAALAPLRRAAALAPGETMISVTLGHALMATEDTANYAEAKRVIKAAVNRDNDEPFAWHVLGTIYAAEGDQARAALAGAEQNSLVGDMARAMALARQAMGGLGAGPDYLRAQDIFMVAQAELKKDKKRRRD